MHLLSIVGARPNFVKIAPIAREIINRPHLKHTLVHTGQHYDDQLSHSFFKVLSIPQPQFNLGVGSGNHGVQTGKIMVALEPLLEELRPDWVLTVGDVNSTTAAALVAVKMNIKTAHVEAGLRSNDRGMPEEINRIVTDSISDALFVTEQSGWDNLIHEGIPEEKIHFTGNVMIDSLVHVLPTVQTMNVHQDYGLEKGQYALVTLHRPSNVDVEDILTDLLQALKKISSDIPVLFPVHPRTMNRINQFGLHDLVHSVPNFRIISPLDYISFLSLVSQARLLITDSGGIQEETTYLGVPCLTLRPNTERPVTITLGTNRLVPPDSRNLLAAFRDIMSSKGAKKQIPPKWDGRAAGRILDILEQL